MKTHVLRGQTGYDPLWNMCPIFSELAEDFEEVYTLEKILTVDEDICVF